MRSALYRSLATALIDHGRITTTVAKAKSLSGYIDKLITNAKKNSISATRLLSKDIGAVTASKLVKEIGPKFNTKSGGYTRMIKRGQRISDGTPMAIIEWSI